MATADLGVRILLEDGARAGFDALNLSTFGLGSNLFRLKELWNSLEPAQRGAGLLAVGAGADFKLFSAALDGAMSAAGDLQASMLRVSIAVRGADEDTQGMQTTLTNLADYSIFSSQQVADGFVMLGERGATAANIIHDGLGKSMVDFAEATNSQTVPAADLLASTLNVFNLKATDSENVASQLTAAFYDGIPSIDGLQQALAQAGSVAHGSGMSLGEFLTTLDLMVKKGIPASQAATSLRYMIQALQDPTAKAAKEMANLGVISVNDAAPGLLSVLDATNRLEKNPLRLTGTLSDLQDLFTKAQKVGALHTDQSFFQWALGVGAIKSQLYDANGNFLGMSGILDQLGPKLANLKTPQDFQLAMEQMFNVRGGKGAQTLLDDLSNTDDLYKRIKQDIENAGKSHTVLKDADKITSGWNATTKELGSTWHSTAATIGGPAIAAMTPLAKGLNDLLNSVRTHHPEWLKFIGIFLMVGKVLSGVALIAGVAFLAFSIGLAPIIGIVLAVMAGIAALSAVIAFLIMHWNGVTRAIHPVTAAFQSFMSGAGKLLGPLFKDVGKELGVFSKLLDSMMVPVIKGQLIPAWHNLMTALHQAKPTFDFIGKVLMLIGGVIIGSILVPAFIAGFAIIMGVIHAAMVVFKALAMIFSGAVGIISGLLQMLIGSFHLTFGILHAIVTGNFNAIPGIAKNAFQMMGNGILDVLKGVGVALLGVFVGIFGGLAAFLGGATAGIVMFFKNMGAAIMRPIDDVIAKIGHLISSIQKIPGVGGVVHAAAGFLHVPGMAKGGVVTGPTLAVVGEGNEPEVVMPVSKLASFMDNYKSAGGGHGGIVVVNNILDGRVIGQTAIDTATGQLRQLGASRMFR